MVDCILRHQWRNGPRTGYVANKMWSFFRPKQCQENPRPIQCSRQVHPMLSFYRSQWELNTDICTCEESMILFHHPSIRTHITHLFQQKGREKILGCDCLQRAVGSLKIRIPKRICYVQHDRWAMVVVSMISFSIETCLSV